MKLDNKTHLVIYDLMQLHESANDRVKDSLLTAAGCMIGGVFNAMADECGIALEDGKLRYYTYANVDDAEAHRPALTYTLNIQTGVYTKKGKRT